MVPFSAIVPIVVQLPLNVRLLPVWTIMTSVHVTPQFGESNVHVPVMSILPGDGVGLATTRYFESLGMPLVKTVTRAGPAGKLFTGVEVNEVSDQPAIGSTGRNATWLLSMARSWTTG